MGNKLQQAKQRISIRDLWQYYQLPGSPSRSCRSPFREDRNPSFSVSPNGKFWNDFGTGNYGDQIDFIAAAEEISIRDACHRILELASNRDFPKKKSVRTSIKSVPKKKGIHRSVIRRLRDGTNKELEGLLRLRNFPILGLIGLRRLQNRGQLQFFDADNTQYWCITDSSYKNLQIRRLDGRPCKVGDREVKTKTWPGSQATWPIGLDKVPKFDSVVILEGGPDLLAASIFCNNEFPEMAGKIGYLCITGASMKLSREVAIKLNGKVITIVEHADRAGERASKNWSKQLTTGFTSNVRTFRLRSEFNDPSINDLADLVASRSPSIRGVNRLRRMISRRL